MFQFPGFASYTYIFNVRYLITITRKMRCSHLFNLAHVPYAFLPECWHCAGAIHQDRRPNGLYGRLIPKQCARNALTINVKAKQKVQQLKFSSYLRWVAPFGNPRIKGYSHLPVAYRSVSRPSSPVHAKASTKCP